MLTTDSQKKCIHCEEAIHRYATSCPYCGTDLSDCSDEVPVSPYVPPLDAAASKVAESPFVVAGSESASEQENLSTSVANGSDSPAHPSLGLGQPTQMIAVVRAMGALLFGMVFLLFGLALFLYGKDGVLTLHWNAHHWVFYVLAAIPLLLFGWRWLQDVDEEDLCSTGLEHD